MTGAVSGLKQASESATQTGAASETTLGGTSGTVPGETAAAVPDLASGTASHAPHEDPRRRPPYPARRPRPSGGTAAR